MLFRSGKNVWGAIGRGSRNLQRNDAQFQKLAKTKPNPNQLFSDLVSMNYFPQKKMVSKKMSKRLRKKMGQSNIPKQQKGMPSPWELP